MKPVLLLKTSADKPVRTCVVRPVFVTNRPRGVIYAFLNDKSKKACISKGSTTGGGALIGMSAANEVVTPELIPKPILMPAALATSAPAYRLNPIPFSFQVPRNALPPRVSDPVAFLIVPEADWP